MQGLGARRLPCRRWQLARPGTHHASTMTLSSPYSNFEPPQTTWVPMGLSSGSLVIIITSLNILRDQTPRPRKREKYVYKPLWSWLKEHYVSVRIYRCRSVFCLRNPHNVFRGFFESGRYGWSISIICQSLRLHHRYLGSANSATHGFVERPS